MPIHGDVLIQRPPEVVFDFVADERNNYDPGIRDAQLLTGGPIDVGTRFRCISAGRRPVGMIVEIVEYERPRRLTTVTRLTGMDIASTLEFRPAGDATRLHWTSDLHPHGLLRPFGQLLAAFGRRRTHGIWTGLKQTLERQPADARPRHSTEA